MPSAIVYGGRGALGATTVRFFKNKGWRVISIDLDSNQEADHSITVSTTQTLAQQGIQATAQVSDILKDAKASAILCVAGGWQGGNATSDTFLDTVDTSISQSIYPSAIAAAIASKHLETDGLLALTGAQAVANFQGTPGMIGYGLAKAAVHQMVASLAMQDSGVGARTVGILPTVIDTPANRSAMPDADFTLWTPPEHIARQLHAWATRQAPCESGKLYTITTANGSTNFEAN
ncbi:hypothetical protein GGI07_000618 [Coemansia sp. Benny D115]|nr:hypothetical protein GGI07_000618 [Coemansia sp. Benny D115]